jgi:hypothetical protein
LSAIVDAIRDANAAPFFLSASFVLAVLPGARAADADSVHEALAGVVGASCPIARTVGHLFMVAPDDDRDAGPVLAGSAVDDLLRALYTDN